MAAGKRNGESTCSGRLSDASVLMKEQQTDRFKALIDDWVVPVLIDEFLRERELGPYQTSQIISRKLPVTVALDPEFDPDSEPPRIASAEHGQ
jgi:hypothetical protein